MKFLHFAWTDTFQLYLFNRTFASTSNIKWSVVTIWGSTVVASHICVLALFPRLLMSLLYIFFCELYSMSMKKAFKVIYLQSVVLRLTVLKLGFMYNLYTRSCFNLLIAQSHDKQNNNKQKKYLCQSKQIFHILKIFAK